MGTCKYTLWQSTDPDDSCEFRVETKNEKRSRYSTVSWTRMIDFYMGSTQVRILKGGSVMVGDTASFKNNCLSMAERYGHNQGLFCIIKNIINLRQKKK